MAPVPINALPLLVTLDQHLLALLRSLAPADWHRPTLARQWTVKDVATHLLDGNLRTLSLLRDGYAGDPPGGVTSYEQLLAYLNRLNADWVQATRRLSPAVLIELLAQSGREYVAFLATLDPWAPAAFPVAWAGENQSPNWFHVAREYTEKWHHQQQIREAVGQPDPLLAPALLRPLFETFVRGLPHAYRNAAAPVGTVVRLTISGAGGGTWQLEKAAAWQLVPPTAAPATAEIELPPQVAWQLFTKALSPAEALPLATLAGDRALAKIALGLVAVMA